MVVEAFTVLDKLIYDSHLVISHCGAGILLESLRARNTTAIAVVNDSLMGNHQMELADKLNELNYTYKATPGTVLEKVREFMVKDR